MTNPLTAVFLIVAWMPTELPDSLGIERALIRETQLLRITFKAPEAQAAFPARARAAIEGAGGEVVIIEEVKARYK